jgi:hypothetical protein
MPAAPFRTANGRRVTASLRRLAITILRLTTMGACAAPTKSPQVRVLAAFPHRFPTDKTAFPGTRRHTC